MTTPGRSSRGRPQGRATLRDVAKLAGVSISVVSRELNGDPVLRARDETRRNIQEAARALRYTPSHAARSLRLARAFAIGLLLPEVTNPIYDLLIRGIEDAADKLGYQVLLGRTERLQPEADLLRRLVGEGRVDGFLVQRRDETDVVEFGHLIEGGAPVVLLNSRGPRRGSAVLDDSAGARLATEHLLELGHRDIALIGGDVHSYTGRARERGYLEAMKAAGMRRRSAWILHSGYSTEAGARAICQLSLTRGRRPTAVVVANLTAALGVLRGAREIRLTVPEQLSVVAIHNSWLADYSWPSLTTVRMPLYELGQEGVRLLHLRLTGERAMDITVDQPIPVLVDRASTAPPPRRITRARRAGPAGPQADSDRAESAEPSV